MSEQLEWDPLNTTNVFSELFTNMVRNPQKVMQANLDLWKQGLQQYQNNLQTLMGYDTGEETEYRVSDRRFRHSSWNEQPAFNAIKDAGLPAGEVLQQPAVQVIVCIGIEQQHGKGLRVEFAPLEFIFYIDATQALATAVC